MKAQVGPPTTLRKSVFLLKTGWLRSITLCVPVGRVSVSVCKEEGTWSWVYSAEFPPPGAAETRGVQLEALRPGISVCRELTFSQRTGRTPSLRRGLWTLHPMLESAKGQGTDTATRLSFQAQGIYTHIYRCDMPVHAATFTHGHTCTGAYTRATHTHEHTLAFMIVHA